MYGWPTPSKPATSNAGTLTAAGTSTFTAIGAAIKAATLTAAGAAAMAAIGAINPPSGAETLITPITWTNPTASAKTNEPVWGGLPLAAGVLQPGDHVAIYDQGSGGARGPLLASFQLDNEASDLTTRRFTAWSGILPNIGAGSTRVGQMWRVPTAPPSGTAISEADILALAGMANGGCVFSITIGGITYTRTLASAMAGGSTFTKTGATKRGFWRAGVTMSEGIYQAPLQTGGSAHAGGDGVTVEFHVKAFKAGTGAVSGSNPIIALVIDVVPLNGWRAVANQYSVASASIQRATSLTNPALITTNDTDPDGNVQVYNFTTAFTEWGNAGWRRRIYIGQKPTTISMLGDATLTGGTAATPTGSQLAAYLATTGLWPKYKKTLADINHTTRISHLNQTNRAIPLHFATRTIGGATSNFMGNVLLNLDLGGEWPDRGLVAGYTVEGVLKPDANGRRIIFENAEYLLAARTHGLGLNYGSATEKYYKPGDTYTTEAAGSAGDPWTLTTDGGTHHEPEQAYTAYLLTGDYLYYNILNARCASYAGYANTSSGTGANMTFLGDWSKGGQWQDHYAGGSNRRWIKSNIEVRAAAWAMRTIWQQALVCPDRFTSANLLSWSKGISRQFWLRHVERAKNVIEASTGPSSTYFRFGDTGPRYYTDFGNPWEFAPWFQGYMAAVTFRAKSAGMGDANLDIFNEWQADWWVDAFNSTAVWVDGMYYGYWDVFGNVALTGPIKSTTEFYERLALRNPKTTQNANDNAQSHRWMVNGTATLSASSGSSITVTLPSSILSTSRASWYTGKWFAQHNGNGVGQITGVPAANQLTISTTASGGASFSTTSLTQNNWSICLPACPEDNPGNGTMPISESLAVGAENHYIDIARSAVAEAVFAGETGMLAVYNYMNAYKPDVDSSNDGIPSLQFDMRP